MTTATFTSVAATGEMQFLNNNVKNSTGKPLTLSGSGGTDIQISAGASTSVTKKVNRITAGATNYYIGTSPSVTAKVNVNITFTSNHILVTW